MGWFGDHFADSFYLYALLPLLMPAAAYRPLRGSLNLGITSLGCGLSARRGKGSKGSKRAIAAVVESLGGWQTIGVRMGALPPPRLAFLLSHL